MSNKVQKARIWESLVMLRLKQHEKVEPDRKTQGKLKDKAGLGGKKGVPVQRWETKFYIKIGMAFEGFQILVEKVWQQLEQGKMI